MKALVNELKSNENLTFFSTKKLKQPTFIKMIKRVKQVVQMHTLSTSMHPSFQGLLSSHIYYKGKASSHTPPKMVDLCLLG